MRVDFLLLTLQAAKGSAEEGESSAAQPASGCFKSNDPAIDQHKLRFTYNQFQRNNFII
jgi:hypothetical protein